MHLIFGLLAAMHDDVFGAAITRDQNSRINPHRPQLAASEGLAQGIRMSWREAVPSPWLPRKTSPLWPMYTSACRSTRRCPTVWLGRPRQKGVIRSAGAFKNVKRVSLSPLDSPRLSCIGLLLRNNDPESASCPYSSPDWVSSLVTALSNISRHFDR